MVVGTIAAEETITLIVGRHPDAPLRRQPRIVHPGTTSTEVTGVEEETEEIEGVIGDAETGEE